MWHGWRNEQRDKEHNEEPPKEIHTGIVNWCLTKEQRLYNAAKIVFSTNYVGITKNSNAQKNGSKHRPHILHKI